MKCLLLFSAVKRCNWHVLKKQVWSNVLCLCWYLVHVLAVYTVLCQTHAVMWHRHLEASDVTFDFIVLATLNKIVEFAAKWKNSRYQHLPAVCRVSEADTVTNICLLCAGYLKLTLLQTSGHKDITATSRYIPCISFFSHSAVKCCLTKGFTPNIHMLYCVLN